MIKKKKMSFTIRHNWAVTRAPQSEVRGRSREDPMPEGQRPRGVTPRSRPGAAGRSHPAPEARGGGWEEQPHVQGAVAVWAQEGLEELFHVQGQERRR